MNNRKYKVSKHSKYTVQSTSLGEGTIYARNLSGLAASEFLATKLFIIACREWRDMDSIRYKKEDSTPVTNGAICYKHTKHMYKHMKNSLMLKQNKWFFQQGSQMCLASKHTWYSKCAQYGSFKPSHIQILVQAETSFFAKGKKNFFSLLCWNKDKRIQHQ